ncbi:hypothetical protein FZEAL_2291 [Fusarium zealandicum]|uniref:Uncharacterized protein n=1 Tax=Fusarium zealandicum TaxID=1053134 RepID=A0A8H4UR82_9HYPO|nr:hypothetical protein FZEAL_2291 [Fusarium zealandicum]
MGVVVHGNHQSYTQTQQSLPLDYAQTSPLPVPGTHAHPHTRGRVEGEIHDSAQDALSSSFRSARSMPVSEDTEHESDGSRFHEIQSTRSSITTLDGAMSRLPPPPRQTIPPPPPPPNLRASAILSHSLPRSLNGPPFLRPPPPPPNSHFGPPRPTSLPPPPSPLRHDHDTPRPRQAKGQGLFPPPAPPWRSTDTASQATSEPANQPPAHNAALPKTFIELTPPRNAQASIESIRSSRGRSTRKARRFRHHDSNTASDSSAYTTPRLTDDLTSISGSTSEEDSVVLRNSRQFPPLLPTAPNVTSQGRTRKASMTNRITSWVSQYERSRTPRRPSGTEPKPGPPLKTVDVARSHVSRGSGSSEDAVEQLWTKLKDKRARLNGIKTRMAKKRKRLRELRRMRDDADNAFMSVIRPMLVAQNASLGTSSGSLEPRLADMQRLRTEYQALEGDYEELEATLDEEEDELNSLETRFFSLLAVGHGKTMGPSSDAVSIDDQETWLENLPDDLKGISPHGPPEDLHPSYLELMSAVGDLDNAKEELEELHFLKQQHEGEMRMKTAAGMEMSEHEAEFFTEFPSEEQHMRDSVSRLEREVARLRQFCEEKGVMRKHLSSRVAYQLYPERGYEDIDLDDTPVILQRHSSLVHPKFSVLLSQPEHIMEDGGPQTPREALRAAVKLPDSDPAKRQRMQLASKEFAIDRLVVEHDEGGKGHFINRWLLHQLRLSSLSVLLLYATFINSRALKIRDLWRWQTDVLHYWWSDDAARIPDSSSTKLVTSENSNCGSRVGTTQLSRAATLAADIFDTGQSQVTSSSVAQSARV